MELLLPFNEELLAGGVVPVVGVEPGVAVGVIPDVAVGVGDGCLVGVGTGGVVPTVGFGAGVEPTAVGNAPGPPGEVAVAVKPSDVEGVAAAPARSTQWSIFVVIAATTTTGANWGTRDGVFRRRCLTKMPVLRA